MPNAVDKLKLIAEIRKRPEIWDVRRKKCRSALRKTWKELALTMGADVDECKRKWKNLRCNYRDEVKKLEIRIDDDKLSGSYDPNNEYRSQWFFYDHMKFIHGIKKPTPMILDNKSLVEREILNAIDKFKLIAEIRKRPALWDIQSEEHKSCLSVKEVWKDLAVSMGSDVETCKQIWNNLCRDYRARKKRMELRIKKEKLKGLYDPNKDYSSKWVFYEHMKFIKYIKHRKPSANGNNNSLDERVMSNVTEKSKLIAEIRKRRELWDIQSEEHRSCFSFAKVWKDLAVSIGSDVGTCQRTWISLCKVYRRSVNRMESRIKKANLNGSYDPNNDYSSKWDYFEDMQFMKDNQTGPIILRSSSEILKLIGKIRKRPAIWEIQSKEHRDTITLLRTWKELALDVGSDEVDDCKRKWTNLLLTYRSEVQKLKLRIQEAKLKGSYNPNNDYSSEWTYFEHMKFIDNIMKLRNSTVNDNNSEDSDSNLFSNFHNMDNIKMEPELDLEPEVFVPDDDNDKPTTSNWKSTKRSYNQANVVDDLEKDDHKLIKSPRSDIKDSNDMVHVNDSDYNFLVSFLPQMEKINELQNLQFRTKITNLVLNIMSPSLNNDTESVS